MGDGENVYLTGTSSTNTTLDAIDFYNMAFDVDDVHYSSKEESDGDHLDDHVFKELKTRTWKHFSIFGYSLYCTIKIYN